MTERRTPYGSSSEQGVALIWAIIIMIVVLGFIVLVASSTMSTVRETRDSATRTRAVFWAEAAGKDLVARMDDAEIGPWVTGRSGADLYLSFAGGAPAGIATPPANRQYAIGADRRAIPLTGSGTERGWYQVLPPAGLGSPAWTGVKVMNPARPGDQGSVQFVIRAWADLAGAQPVLVRVELRRNALSRFSLLSEDQLTLGGLGALSLRGAIHTNNARNAPQAIQVAPSTNVGGARSVTTTRGAISGCGSGVCRANVRETVSFGSAARAMRHVEQLSRRRCAGATFAACAPPPPAAGAGTTIPAWHVNLAAAGGCIDVGTMLFNTRTDAGNYATLDDRRGPIGNATGVRRYCPAANGGAIVLDGDVVVSGLRAATAPPVTIMARRTAAFPATATVPSGGVRIRVSAPASIYLEQSANGAGIGAQSPPAGQGVNPVGLVAEGGIFLPSWALRESRSPTRSGRNDTLVVRNVAAMASTGEIAYSPSIQAIAADGSLPGGLGINAVTARMMQYGYGSSFSFTGSLISAGRMVFRYGQTNEYVGYGTRTLAYEESLAWNPPPWFPADSDWHVADWTEFDA